VTSVAQTPVHRELGAMSCDVELVCYAPDAGRRLARAERWLRGFESRFSRFQPASELSRLNAAAGRPFSASPRLMQLAGAALALACRSGGVFDPTVLRSLEAAGYDRSFELLDRRWPPDPLSPRERARVRVFSRRLGYL
jgi:thiamine biosynthesis lipoprotein